MTGRIRLPSEPLSCISLHERSGMTTSPHRRPRPFALALNMRTLLRSILPLALLAATACSESNPISGRVEAPDTVRVAFKEDRVEFPGLGCTTELFAQPSRGGTPISAVSVAFTSTVPGVVSLATNTGRTGTTRGMATVVRSEQAGVTRVIATYEGAADTAVVTVHPDTPTSIAVSNNGLLGVGTTKELKATVRAACKVIASAPVTYRSENPDIASVDPSGVVTGRSAGETTLFAESSGLVATVSLRVLKVSIIPADTTVVVGDTVRYQISATDGSGNQVTPTVLGLRSDAPSVASFPFDTATVRNWTATAHAPGTAPIIGYLNGHEGRAVLRVVPRP